MLLREKAVQNGKLEMQNEKIRLSRDLHDNIGAELTMIATESDNISLLVNDTRLKNELKSLRDYSTVARNHLGNTR